MSAATALAPVKCATCGEPYDPTPPRPGAPPAHCPRCWRPHRGGQERFLATSCHQAIATGDRGGGKTDALLIDFASEIGRHGEEWWGVLFRRTYPQFEDLIKRGNKLFCGHRFAGVVGRATYVSSPSREFRWPGGERLILRFATRERDYQDTLGWNVPWLGFEELCEWPDDSIYNSLVAINRTATRGVPLRIRATANAYGRGKNWVKRRFVDPAPMGRIFFDGSMSTVRISIPRLENVTAEAVDPGYRDRLKVATRGNAAKAAAWLDEDWTVTGGGLLDDLWDEAVHVIEPFEPPASWRIDRSYDHGTSHPWAVGWWAESDGTTAPNGRTYPPGTLFLIAEAYGDDGSGENRGDRRVASAQAAEIRRRQESFPWGSRVQPGPADSNIFNSEAVSARSIADEFEDAGVRWTRADKSSGSRVRGAELIRQRLAAAFEEASRTPRASMEEPGLFIFDTCRHWIRTVPPIPRSEKDPDDADTEWEDHLYDLTRYRCSRQAPPQPGVSIISARWQKR